MECKEAPEPSNLIWENLQDSPAEMNQMKGQVFFVLIMALVVIFTILASLKQSVIKTTKKYPAAMDCNKLMPKKKDVTIYKQFATEDKTATDALEGIGYFYCYCKLNTSVRDAINWKEFK